jgi:hypothetical protein
VANREWQTSESALVGQVQALQTDIARHVAGIGKGINQKRNSCHVTHFRVEIIGPPVAIIFDDGWLLGSGSWSRVTHYNIEIERVRVQVMLVSLRKAQVVRVILFVITPVENFIKNEQRKISGSHTGFWFSSASHRPDRSRDIITVKGKNGILNKSGAAVEQRFYERAIGYCIITVRSWIVFFNH